MQEKEIKNIQIGKEELKSSLFAGNMILCIEIPKDSAKKLLELVNGFFKIAGHNINIQKSVVFLYTNNEGAEREIKKTIPFTIAPKRIKYLGINVIKEVIDLYSENCKMLKKKTEDNTNKWKDKPCSWLEELKSLKCPYYPERSKGSIQSPSIY